MNVRQRQPREECPAFLAFVRRRACCVCGAPAPSQAAHIRTACRTLGKRSTGLGEKPSDRWAVPLCSDCHLDSPQAQHRIGEYRFWTRVGINPFKLALMLYAQFERRRDRAPAQRVKVVKRATQMARRRLKKAKISQRRNPWPKGRTIPRRIST